MTAFSNPSFLLAGAALVVVISIAFTHRARRFRRLAAFLGGRRAARRLGRKDLLRLPTERVIILALASLAMAAAAADPREPPARPEAEIDSSSSARSVMVAIDVSASMQGTDVTSTRLGAAVRVAQGLVESMEGSEVGLLLFAGKAYTLTPPTNDHRGVRYLLRGVTPRTATAWDPSSRLSAGIREAVAQLVEAGGTDKMIVLISDGATVEPEDEALSAVRAAVSGGISVHTVGVGSHGVGTAGAADFREALLRRLAQVGGGTYTDGTAASEAVGPGRVLDGESARIRHGPWRGVSDLRFLLTLAALLLLLVDGFLEDPVGLRWRTSARGAS